MVCRQNTDRVSANFVGRVTIGSDAVRPGDNGLNLALFHKPTCHIVADQTCIYSCLLQLPGREPGALQQGPGFIRIDGKPSSRAPGLVKDRQRGPLPSLEIALADQHAVFTKWNQAARCRGGWMWRQTAQRWVATLPEIMSSEGLPFAHAPCNRG